MSIVSLDPLVISPVISVSSDRHSYDFLSFLSIFTDGPVTYHTLEAGGTQDVFVTVSDFSYTFTGTSISIRYTTDYRGYGDTAHWDSSFYIPFDMQDELLTPVVGHTYHGGTVGYTTFSFSGGSGVITDNPPLGALSDTYTAGFGQRNIKLLLSVPSMFDVSKPTAESVSLYFSKYKSLSSFASAFDLSFRDIVASSMFSSVDAFKKAEGSLNRDVLQDLSKLPDIASAIPDISKAIDIVLSLAKGRPLRSLKDILDFATQLELQKDFQIRPVITLLTEYLPAMLKSINHLGLPSKLITSYGSFTFKLPPGSLGREDVTLVTRTKMVLDGSSSGLLSAALGYDARPCAEAVESLGPRTIQLCAELVHWCWKGYGSRRGRSCFDCTARILRPFLHLNKSFNGPRTRRTPTSSIHHATFSTFVLSRRYVVQSYAAE
jgi:hypothetical protein